MVPFKRADILLPDLKDGAEMEKWAVIACDQFTSEPEYWKEAEKIAEGSVSALNLILPEVYLDEKEKIIPEINGKMREYLSAGIFKEYKNSYIYVERIQPDGRLRRGICGAVDLDAYDYRPGAHGDIRATEETVISRIPPRVEIRKDAPVELPHVILLYDDPENALLSAIDKNKLTKLYDFDLMLGGGRITGWLLDGESAEKFESALSSLYEKSKSLSRPFLAVGDGNHSLAAAKSCAEQGFSVPEALCEIVNIHEEAIDFEPIYRLIKNVNTGEVLKLIKELYGDNKSGSRVDYHTADGDGYFFTPGLPVRNLKELTDICSDKGADVDYIHGKETAVRLGKKENSISFTFDSIEKKDLFAIVGKNGVLPKKTFSIGDAKSKRYYIEAKKIK